MVFPENLPQKEYDDFIDSSYECGARDQKGMIKVWKS
jgi:hypothetical protein